MSGDYPDFATPQAHATAIYEQRVPLARDAVTLQPFTNQNFSSGDTLMFDGPTDYQSYEISVSAQLPLGAGTIPFYAIDFVWKDSSSLFNTWQHQAAGCAGNGQRQTSFFRGNVKGANAQIGFINLDPAQTMTADIVIEATSILHDHDHAVQTNYAPGPPIGFTFPKGKMFVNAIATYSPTFGPGSSAPRLLALAGGKWKIHLDNQGQANACGISITDPAGLFFNAGDEVYGNSVAAGGTLHEEIASPMTPLLLTLTNNGGAGNITPKFSAVLLDY